MILIDGACWSAGRMNTETSCTVQFYAEKDMFRMRQKTSWGIFSKKTCQNCVFYTFLPVKAAELYRTSTGEVVQVTEEEPETIIGHVPEKWAPICLYNVAMKTRTEWLRRKSMSRDTAKRMLEDEREHILLETLEPCQMYVPNGTYNDLLDSVCVYRYT